ncbi:hypothetical protein NQ318_015041 [Aromia moschata]|uniref:Rhythmically expressed gene 5 protein n=1 Tax=Aromia moschata TaxID=1265417 RepID=A0AAV8YZU8_9CUCU|nr:hypothetical protein NQ318_015041 [Aromia moschata]
MIAVLVLCFCAILGGLDASAIPMWEYLSKQEKMSFLYSQFANQVDSFCETSTMMDCNKELLKYGLNTLKNMKDEVLDNTDPYQRGANHILWKTLLEGHPLSRTFPKPKGSSTTAKPNSYDDESFGDTPNDEFGYQSAASAKIDNVYRVPPPKGFVEALGKEEPQAYGNFVRVLPPKGFLAEMEKTTPKSESGYKMAPPTKYVEVVYSGNPEYIYPHNAGLFSGAFDGPVMDKDAMDKFQETPAPSSRRRTTTPSSSTDATTSGSKRRRIASSTSAPVSRRRNSNRPSYVKIRRRTTTTTTSLPETASIPLTGPMVIRVYPDGTPVDGQEPVVQDEDLRQHNMAHVSIPNL